MNRGRVEDVVRLFDTLMRSLPIHMAVGHVAGVCRVLAELHDLAEVEAWMRESDTLPKDVRDLAADMTAAIAKLAALERAFTATVSARAPSPKPKVFTLTKRLFR